MALFTRQCYGVVGALKKALWHYEGTLAPPPSSGYLIGLHLVSPRIAVFQKK